MFSPNRTVQKQISDTLGIVSTVEFPEQWPEILPVCFLSHWIKFSVS